MTSQLRAACPHCDATFGLTAARLDAREGLVDCDVCGRQFNAKWNLVEPPLRSSVASSIGKGYFESRPLGYRLRQRREPPDLKVTREPPTFAAASETTAPETTAPTFATAPEAPVAPEATAPEATTNDLEMPDATDWDDLQAPHPTEPNPDAPPAAPTPSQIRVNQLEHHTNPDSNLLGTLLWLAVSVGFVVLFGWQVKYFFVEKYAQDDDYRRYLTAFCKVAACQLPPRHDPSRFTLTHTKIDLHPRTPGALRVTVKLVNEATFAQPYPDLRLTLTDRDGRVVGRRAFSPRHYLAAGQPNALGSGELGVVRFDLARPHEKAVGFEVNVLTHAAAS